MSGKKEGIKHIGYEWNGEVWDEMDLPWADDAYKKELYSTWAKKDKMESTTYSLWAIQSRAILRIT